MKNCNQTNYGSSLFLGRDVSGPIRSCVEYLATLIYTRIVCLQDAYWRYWALTLALKAVFIAKCSVLTACSVLLEKAQWRVDSLHAEGHVPIYTPLVHLFVSEGILLNSGKCFKHNLFPLILTIFLSSHRNIFQRILPEIGWNQIGRLRDLLYFWGYYCLG